VKLPVYLGVDIGTYEAKGALVDASGQLLASASRPHELSIPRPGWAEHDAEQDWWQGFRWMTQRLLDQSGLSADRIAAVGCSAIGPCLVPVDSDGRPLRKAILYGIDTRATEEISELEQRIGAERVFETCANALTTQSVGPKILWLRRHEPDVFAEAKGFLTSTSFLVRRLTGETRIDHYTAAGFTPLYDVHSGRWNEDLTRGIVEVERLPRLGWTSEVAGTVTAEASAATGLAVGTPVITGTVDAAAEAVSVGVVRPGQMMIMYGSTLFMIQVVADAASDARLWAAPYLFPGTHALMGGMATTGALTRWFRDQLARELPAGEDEAAGDEPNPFAVLADEAADIPPGADGLVCLPYFSGERTPINDPHARGIFFGLTLAHSRAHLYRAALESVGYGIRHHLEVLAEIGTTPKELAAVGGGTKNPLWLQLVSDVTQREQRVAQVTMGAAYGDAFLARLGSEPSLKPYDIGSWVKPRTVVKPDRGKEGRYAEVYGVYRDLYRQTRELMHRLQAISAAGG
jgi:xylulokinase